jgi:hypothetical protein
VFFVNGRQRSCLVVHRPPRYLGKKGMRPAETVVRSFESAAMPDCDLRNQKQAAELEQMLLEHG